MSAFANKADFVMSANDPKRTARMGIIIALRELLPKPSPAYGSRFKNNHRHEVQVDHQTITSLHA